MNIEDLNKEGKALKAEYEDKLSKLNRRYAHANSPARVGDIIKDHMGYGVVRAILCSGSWGESNTPSCVYVCDNMPTKMRVSKREPKRNIYQCNLKEINFNPVQPIE